MSVIEHAAFPANSVRSRAYGAVYGPKTAKKQGRCAWRFFFRKTKHDLDLSMGWMVDVFGQSYKLT
ncbi:hypothetical protein GTNG_1281 [Geobacillus thermodenitrificans NG80-2]|uniref:Uncharacterized protein n=1 Tax=Geobacillus thermodenitrificans (strain NG80-2) TaxID=420246 RepID=A4IMU7_GEOTN|nr:hypothetical protein GTNG_1281 [Geobacillus thermodenitrificans NG80-2]